MQFTTCVHKMKIILLFAIWLCISARAASVLRRFYLYADITNKVCDSRNAAFGTFYTTSRARCALWCITFFRAKVSSTHQINPHALDVMKHTQAIQLTGKMEGSLYFSKVPIDDRGMTPFYFYLE